MQFKGSGSYYINSEMASIVNMAIAMQKPLLLTGEPGTGKTQLAFEIASELNMPLEILRAKSTIKGEESCYVQDTVLRLNDARFGPGDSGRDVQNFYDYIIWGPIGRAFRNENRTVLLLDEIDKTESDVQDNLLDVLEENEFTIRETNHVIKAAQPPVILITSNAKRELSDPFLRRCFSHHIAFPTPDEMHEIVKLHFSDTGNDLIEAAIKLFYELRSHGYDKAPATGELLHWIAALKHDNQIPENVKDLPYIGTLLKRASDLKRYKGGSVY